MAENFFEAKMRLMFGEGKSIVDVGNGLRVVREKGNIYRADREWLRPLIEKADYKVMDVVDTYHPDIVGDIQKMPFANSSLDGLIVIAVLQHVEDQKKAWAEIHRVLKPGGHAFIYVPFLYYYAGLKGYYKDYWRFSRDAVEMLSSAFEKVEISPVRGAIETWIYISPIGRIKWLHPVWRFFDRITGKTKSTQVSAYDVFLTK